MKQLLRSIILIVSLVTSIALPSALAQEVVWDIDFDFRFDNREYGDPSKMIVPSETIFGANISPEAGIGWGYGHSLMMGATLHADMGSEKFFESPEFIAYYNFDSSTSRLNASLGLFPRNKLAGRYTRAIFDETYKFYHPTIEGALLRYSGSYWFSEIACDWNGLRSSTRREMFTILMAGEANKGFSYAGYNFMLHHHAASDTAKGVTDNGLLSLYLGLKFSFDKAFISAQASWLQAYQNERYHIRTPMLPAGYELLLQAKYGDVGLNNTFYCGDNLMPYWDLPYEDAEGNIYGSSLYSGDPFYRVGESGFHNRLELYWEPTMKDGISLRFASVHHYDGAHWGWQQLITMSVDLNSGMFAPIN